MADRTFCDPGPIRLGLYLSNILAYPISRVDFLLCMFRVPNFQPSFLHLATFSNFFFDIFKAQLRNHLQDIFPEFPELKIETVYWVLS